MENGRHLRSIMPVGVTHDQAIGLPVSTGNASVRGSSTFIFPTFQTFLLFTASMSAAWHGGLQGADNFAQDGNLLEAIQRAMDYWFLNDFVDAACVDSGGTAACPCGTPGFWNINWFSNVSRMERRDTSGLQHNMLFCLFCRLLRSRIS